MEAPMSDAPETIWACYDPQDKTTYWAAPDNPYAEGDLVGAYRRADLPPTDAQLMADPRVTALVEALKTMRDDRTGYRHAAHFRRRISVILAAFPAQRGKP
jgi:hypothetical protein